ncbi:MAG: flavin reductase family protein [Rhodothermales bacterium]
MSDFDSFAVDALTAKQTYKLLSSVVVPRPIAWITTVDEAGRVNAAPYSFFNMMGAKPPVVAFGPTDRPTGSYKDTFQNIRTNRAFVVNLVNEDVVEAMVMTATDFPSEESEVEALGLETVPSDLVAPPRLAASPVQLECREAASVQIGQTRVVLGEVVRIHLRDGLLDPERFYVRADQLRMVGRMHGGGWYTRTQDRFEVPRMTYGEWTAKQRGE